MLLEYFLFFILNNAMAFVNMHIFSLTFYILIKSLFLLTVTLRGVSNKHCLLSLFFNFLCLDQKANLVRNTGQIFLCLGTYM